MAKPVMIIRQYLTPAPDCSDTDLELVVGQHRILSKNDVVAFTKWCPAESDDWSFGTAEAAIDLALERTAQQRIDLLQCEYGGARKIRRLSMKKTRNPD